LKARDWATQNSVGRDGEAAEASYVTQRHPLGLDGAYPWLHSAYQRAPPR